MSAHANELSIPPAALGDPRARELVRVWGAAGRQHVTLASETWKDPAAWGIMIVDLAKHAARAYAQVSGESEASVLRRIREGFDAEWASPSDVPTGALVKDAPSK